MRLNRFNPETNRVLRAFLYVVGCGGIIHLLTLLLLAIQQKNAQYFNPFYTVDIDRLWPKLVNNWIAYIIGWLIFIAAIYTVYRLLNRRPR